MLNCNHCDYYLSENGKKTCEFSEHLFLKNPQDMEKYPCQDISYDSYISAKENKESMEVVA